MKLVLMLANINIFSNHKSLGCTEKEEEGWLDVLMVVSCPTWLKFLESFLLLL